MDVLGFIEQLHAPLSVLMLVIFRAIVAWAYAPHRREEMDERARIPLRDDQ